MPFYCSQGCGTEVKKPGRKCAECPDERELEIRAKWANRPSYTNPPSWMGRFPGEASMPAAQAVVPSDVLVCSFCGKPTSHVEATRSSKHVIVREMTYTPGPPAVIGEEIQHRARKIVACPSCCLNIKPKLDEDGNVVAGSTIKWPASREEI